MAIDTGPSKKFIGGFKNKKMGKQVMQKGFHHPNNKRNASQRKNPNRSVNPMQERMTNDFGFDS